MHDQPYNYGYLNTMLAARFLWDASDARMKHAKLVLLQANRGRKNQFGINTKEYSLCRRCCIAMRTHKMQHVYLLIDMSVT